MPLRHRDARRCSARPSELALDRLEQLAVSFGVDLAAQDLLGAGDGERGHAIAQLLACARDFLRDLGLGGDLLAVALFLRRVARFLDHLRAALFRLADDLGGALARALYLYT